MSGPPVESEALTHGSLQAAISRHIVRRFAEYTGRGPTRARTTIADNLIVCITQDNMTKAERRLTEDDEAETVKSLRRKFQQTMREELVGGVEELTGRTVVAFMSDHDVAADCAAEVFLLDGPPLNGTRRDGLPAE